jgi:hypothetical protein
MPETAHVAPSTVTEVDIEEEDDESSQAEGTLSPCGADSPSSSASSRSGNVLSYNSARQRLAIPCYLSNDMDKTIRGIMTGCLVAEIINNRNDRSRFCQRTFYIRLIHLIDRGADVTIRLDSKGTTLVEWARENWIPYLEHFLIVHSSPNSIECRKFDEFITRKSKEDRLAVIAEETTPPMVMLPSAASPNASTEMQFSIIPASPLPKDDSVKTVPERMESIPEKE